MTSLTKNFTLEEMLESGTARRLKIVEQFNPPEIVLNNLTDLCEHILQPLRDHLGALHISSGYRCPVLNKHVGGQPTSQHMNGQAADVQGTGRITNKMIFEAIQDLKLPFDQEIWEFGTKLNPAWVHVSYSPRMRRQIIYIIG